MSVFRTVKAEGIHEGALTRACEKLGYQLREGTSVRIFGRPVNARWTIDVPGLAYPVGVTTQKDEHGNETLDFSWDNWLAGGGHTDEDVASRLQKAYGEALADETNNVAAEAEEYARQQGWLASREIREDGACVVTVWMED